MTALPLSDEARELLAGPNTAHLATVMRDGSPHTVPIWVGIEGDRVLFYREEGSLGLRNLRRDPRVALSVTDRENSYRYCALRGQVVEERGGAEAIAWLDHTAVAYTGRPYPHPGPNPGVVVVVEVQRLAHVALDGFGD